jgi:uncharacterized protein YbaR (Trm112 family)
LEAINHLIRRASHRVIEAIPSTFSLNESSNLFENSVYNENTYNQVIKDVSFIGLDLDNNVKVVSNDKNVIQDVKNMISNNKQYKMDLEVENLNPQNVKRIYRISDEIPQWAYDIEDFGKDVRISEAEAEAFYGLVPDLSSYSDNPVIKYKKYLDLYMKTDLTENDEKDIIQFLRFFKQRNLPFSHMITIDNRIIIDVGDINNIYTKPDGNISLFLGIIALGAILSAMGAITNAIYSMRSALAAERHLLNSEESLSINVDATGNIAIRGQWRGFGIMNGIFKEHRERRLKEIRDENLQIGKREWGLGKRDGPNGSKFS